LVAGDDGLAAGSRPGLTIVDCTTSDPSTLLRLSEEYAPRGLVFVDAPLGRSPHEAWQGALSTMVGGELTTLERIRPILAAFATTIQHAGALGNGHGSSWSTTSYRSATQRSIRRRWRSRSKPGSTPRPSTTSCAQAVCTVRFYDTFIGWVVSGDRQSHPYALDDALRTISDVFQFSRSVGLKGRLAGSVREIYAKAVADGFGAVMLPELACAVAKANDIDLKPAFDGAPQ
jgi:3-hydroxyisobutyrate dehydrogenase-like beta-hydroxyacid dehydrogenase